jgi:hypothetical protein
MDQQERAGGQDKELIRITSWFGNHRTMTTARRMFLLSNDRTRMHLFQASIREQLIGLKSRPDSDQADIVL